MRKFVGCVCVAVALSGISLPAFAQQNDPAQVTAAPSAYDPGIQRAIDDALRAKFTAGDPDAAVVGPDGKITSLSGALEEEKEDVTYKYDKPQGAFRFDELPKRTFNNIDYPY